MDDVGPLLAVDVGVLDDVPYLLELPAHLYPAPPVGVLAWLDDPDGLAQLVEVAVGPIVVALEDLLELEELLVVGALLDVEGEGQDPPPVLADGLVVDLHVVVDGLLVGEVEVVLHVGVSDHRVGGLLLLLVLGVQLKQLVLVLDVLDLEVSVLAG